MSSSSLTLFKSFVQTNIKYFVGAGILAASLYYYLNRHDNNNNSNTNTTNDIDGPRDHPIRIKKIIIYPIKSCKGIEVRSCKIDKYGFENDRRFMLISSNGRFMSQRTTPRMSLITPDISEDGQWLILNAPGEKEIRIKINDTEGKEVFKVGIWKDDVNVVDCGSEAKEWFSKFLETDVRLVTMAPGEKYNRKVPADYVDSIIDSPTEKDRELYQVALSDSSQVMILSESSITDLNQHIEATRKSKGEKQRDPLTWQNFRPNILVSGYSCLPFEEDTWEQIRVSGLLLKKVSPGCPRCKLTTVQHEQGVINPYDDNEPLRTLETYRKFDTGILFGILFVHQLEQNGEEVFVGDIIDVLKVNNVPHK